MKTLWKMLMMVRESYPRGFFMRIVYVFFQSLLPLANLYVLKLLVDSITRRDMGDAMLYVAVFVAVLFSHRLVSTLSGVNNDILSQRLIDYVSDKIQRQSSRLDMSYYDNPTYHDTFHRAQQEASYRPLEVLNNAMTLVGSALSLAGVAALLASLSPWVVPVLVLSVTPMFVVRLVKSRRLYLFRRENTQTYRRTSYYAALLTQRDYAKELRMYGLAPYFRKLFVEIRHGLVGKILTISRRLAYYDALCAVVEAAALAVVLMLFVGGAYRGAFSIGSFVMLFEAFRRGQGHLMSLVASVAGLYDTRLFAGNLMEFLALNPRVVSPAEPEPMPEKIESVEFRDVTFRYADMSRDVISHFSLMAKTGEVCKIEGENGCGKSTLMKLLMRLYDPDEGAIYINGTDIRRFDLVALRRSQGVLFQDFVRYYFTAGENIAFGDMEQGYDEARVREAAAKSGADEVVVRLDERYDTMLGRMFDGGEELSMGQWQRLALARLFYSDAPVMILDEPTAWMDQKTRQHFYSVLDELKKDRVVFLIRHSEK